jgi:hypothetical protein
VKIKDEDQRSRLQQRCGRKFGRNKRVENAPWGYVQKKRSTFRKKKKKKKNATIQSNRDGLTGLCDCPLSGLNATERVKKFRSKRVFQKRKKTFFFDLFRWYVMWFYQAVRGVSLCSCLKTSVVYN